MKKLKLITICFVPLLVFVGCGQGFQANITELQKAEGSVDADNIQVPKGNTPKSVDQRILDNYMSEFNSLGKQSIEDLISDIRSFEVEVDRKQNQVKGVSVRMHSRTNAINSQGTSITACNNIVNVRDIYITLTQLQSGNPVFLGRSMGYEFEIQCTDSSCDEMVTAVRRISSGSEGLVLIGLQAGSMEGGRDSSYTQKYSPRSVDIEPYFTVAVTPDEYISVVCSLENEDITQNPPPQPPQDVPVDPTGGIFN